jgi:flagellar hook-associated protein 1 FlgK
MHSVCIKAQPFSNGQVGTGVRGEMIERIRDIMLDKQYRDEVTKVS